MAINAMDMDDENSNNSDSNNENGLDTLNENLQLDENVPTQASDQFSEAGTSQDTSQNASQNASTRKRQRSNEQTTPKNKVIPKQPKHSPTVVACCDLANAVVQITKYTMYIIRNDDEDSIVKLRALKSLLVPEMELLAGILETVGGLCDENFKETKEGHWRRTYPTITPERKFEFDPNKPVKNMCRELSSAAFEINNVVMFKVSEREPASDSYKHIRQTIWAGLRALKDLMKSINNELQATDSASPSSDD